MKDYCPPKWLCPDCHGSGANSRGYQCWTCVGNGNDRWASFLEGTGKDRYKAYLDALPVNPAWTAWQQRHGVTE